MSAILGWLPKIVGRIKLIYLTNGRTSDDSKVQTAPRHDGESHGQVLFDALPSFYLFPCWTVTCAGEMQKRATTRPSPSLNISPPTSEATSCPLSPSPVLPKKGQRAHNSSETIAVCVCWSLSFFAHRTPVCYSTRQPLVKENRNMQGSWRDYTDGEQGVACNDRKLWPRKLEGNLV